MVESPFYPQMTGLLTLKAGHKYILHGQLPAESPGSTLQIALITYDDLSGGGQAEYAKIVGVKTIDEGAVLTEDHPAKLVIYTSLVIDIHKTQEEANTYDHVEIPLTIEDIACE